MERSLRRVLIPLCLAASVAGCRGGPSPALNKQLLDAAKVGDRAAVARLLEQGAAIESQNDSGRTPLMLAAVKGDAETEKLLLSRGAKVDARDSAGMTALMWAAFSGNMPAVEALLAKGADPSARDRSGETAVEWGRDHAEVVARLKKGATKAPAH